MHIAVGNRRFITESISQLRDQLAKPSPELHDAIAQGINSTDTDTIAQAMVRLQTHLDSASAKIQTEPDHGDRHYVSRLNPVGLFQSALSKVFMAIPDLQGYGDWNPLWVITEIEVFAYKVKGFLDRVHADHTGKKAVDLGCGHQ